MGKGGDSMTSKKDLSVTVLATLLLTATLFLITPTRSQTPSPTYDPWADINNDGTINILDAIILGTHFLTSGTPINKTALLDLQSQIDALNTTLQSQMAVLNATLLSQMAAYNATLQSQINALNSTLQSQGDALNAALVSLQSSVSALNDSLSLNITSLNSQISSINTNITQLENSLTAEQSKIDGLNESLSSLQTQIINTTRLIWDSGWKGPTIVGDTVFSYGVTLNITNAVVYMEGAETLGGPPHIIDFGGYQYGDYHGAYWYQLTSTSITFHRHGQDTHWLYVRFMIFNLATS
jgi:hypothetical protein